jgi:hypothetical protein
MIPNTTPTIASASTTANTGSKEAREEEKEEGFGLENLSSINGEPADSAMFLIDISIFCFYSSYIS